MLCRPFQLAISLLLSLAALTAAVGAAESTQSSSTLRIRRWTTDDGLPQNRIGCLKQTRDGYLWMGTWFGLVRFNGVSFTVFDHYNTPELAANTINALAEDTAGTLWIATSDGLLSYANHRFQRYSVPEGLAEPEVWRLASSREGGVWVQSGALVQRVLGGRFSPPFEPRLPGHAIQSIQEGPDGWLNIVQELAWVALSPGGDQIRTNFVLNSKAPPWVTGRLTGNADGLWVGTTNGLEHINVLDGQATDTDEMGHHPVHFVFQDRSSRTWGS